MTHTPRTWQEQREAEKAAVTEMRKEWLATEAARYGSVKAMAEGLGMARADIHRLAKQFGLTMPRAEHKGPPVRVTAKRIQACADAGMTLGKTAKALGCGYTYLAARAKAFGIKFKRAPYPKKAKTAQAKTREPKRPAPQPAMTMAQFAARENAAMRRVGRV